LAFDPSQLHHVVTACARVQSRSRSHAWRITGSSFRHTLYDIRSERRSSP